MIKINNNEICIEHFPDGTQRLLDINMPNDKHIELLFDWKYYSDEELVTLIYLVNHFKEHNYVGKYILNMSFVSNGRMDRTCNTSEVFTLKWFCQIINNLNFDKILILDPHSNVTPALLNNVYVDNAKFYILDVIHRISSNNQEVILYFPDYSAMKKYSAIVPDYKYIYGNKKRDWDTGKILGIEIVNDFNIDLKDKTILIVDDLISYGGSMFYGSQKLKELGVGKIYAYATHTENSILDQEKGTLIKLIEDGTVEKLFTTNSLFSGHHEKIIVMGV